jgi:hypothetical protein
VRVSGQRDASGFAAQRTSFYLIAMIQATAYVLVFANSSAHAVATPELGSLPFRGVAHPPASINCR